MTGMLKVVSIIIEKALEKSRTEIDEEIQVIEKKKAQKRKKIAAAVVVVDHQALQTRYHLLRPIHLNHLALIHHQMKKILVHLRLTLSQAHQALTILPHLVLQARLDPRRHHLHRPLRQILQLDRAEKVKLNTLITYKIKHIF